jgi:hypothetical protein
MRQVLQPHGIARLRFVQSLFRVAEFRYFPQYGVCGKDTRRTHCYQNPDFTGSSGNMNERTLLAVLWQPIVPLAEQGVHPLEKINSLPLKFFRSVGMPPDGFGQLHRELFP